MDGEILRGEVYWVSIDDSIGDEEKTGRPAVVISGNGLNEKQNTVVVAFLSLSGFASASRPSISGPGGKRRRVLCDQIRTVDKSRLTKYESKLDESELIRVTGALAAVMNIPLAVSKKEVPKYQDDELPALKAELDMWKRMYTLTMDQLVELRVGAAVNERMKAKENPPIEETPVITPKNPIKKGLVEPDLGYEEDPLPPKKPVSPKKTTSPKKVEWNGVKVNINTVESWQKLKERTGMSRLAATEIVKTRKIVGNYQKVEDLLALENFGETCMKRYGHMLEV